MASEKSPNERKDYYFSDEFQMYIDELLKKKYITNQHELLTLILEFNQKPNLNIETVKNFRLEGIVSSGEQVKLMGESFHFVTKAVQKNYERRTPIPMIKSTFSALSHFVYSDPSYATNILIHICNLTDRRGLPPEIDRQNQSRVYAALTDILPKLAQEYKVALTVGTSDGSKNVEKISEAYKTNINLMLGYTRLTLKSESCVSWEDFVEYKRSKGQRNVYAQALQLQ